MKIFSKDQLIAKLNNEGLFFQGFNLMHEGAYTAEDADWNYKDVPHLHHVHQFVESIIAVVGDELIATINTQKVLAFQFPLAIFNYQSGPNTQTYYTTWLFFVLIIQTQYEEIASNRTRVITNYSVGSPKWLKWCFPLIRFLLKRNYKDLMSTDIPMRERRGVLRLWGYTFAKNKDKYSFEDTMNILKPNVINPQCAQSIEQMIYDLNKILPNNGEYFIGRSDHFGLRLIRKNNDLMIYPRMCPHEGANLDQQKCENKQIKCPWHGRPFNPIASFNLAIKDLQHASFGTLSLKMQKNILEITA